VMSAERVKKAALAPDICHRRPNFERQYNEIRNNLLKLFHGNNDEYTTVVISGSGTASNETVLSSVIRDGQKVLLISNGEFGNRLKDIIDCYGLGLNLVEFNWGEYPDLTKIENELKKDKDISLISMVFHETSTGMINPVHEIGNLSQKYNKIYHVDAISAVGGEDVNVKRDSIDFCTGVPNKAVGGQPGVSFICTKRSRIKQIEDIPRRNIYLNLQHHIKEAEECNQTPNTPSVVMFLTLNEALKVLFEEGIEETIKRYQENASIIRKGLMDLGLELLIKEERIMSNTVTSAFLPPQINVRDFINMMENEGYVLYPGKGPLLDQNLFQVANMGQIFPKDCKEIIRVIRKVLLKKYFTQ
ncbi:MAG: alanine--glyoxylate aminotransferase family protein, partial [Candidatus Atribacteria bacterium]|nr:alanine--glyoxylate aminotransferase family protein [Candidatus Atribacteria bacterium]